ncbi:MAG: MBL fold metallo-hydrolase [Acidobacteria bacterium]|nr:MBL fold metallo-hydrolase [Acidobacteriota bacterium]
MPLIDLRFAGRPRVIATAVLRGAGGLVLIDPGPSSCLPALEQGLADLGGALRDVRLILLTHIHLDHAGATGTIVARVPEARVLVHERGATHMVEPAKLLASATRLYGERMDALWGRFEAVPASRVTPLAGGERLDVAGRAVRVAYTPGHAVHHVAYLDESDGTAYVGDTCGIRVAGDFTIAATPPPDIDLELWLRSLDAIEAWQPAGLFLTHFGPVGAARAHIANYRRVLATTGEVVARSLTVGDTDESRAAGFAAEMREAARRVLSEPEAVAVEQAAPFDQIWAGLARYWRRKAVA